MHPSHLLQEAFRTPQAGDMSPTPTLTPQGGGSISVTALTALDPST